MYIFTTFKLILKHDAIMARVIGGIGGRVSGKVGPVVYVNFNGRNYVRIAPKERKKNSWSPKQVTYRKKFSKVCNFWSGTVPTKIKQIWDLDAERMNGFNLFVKTNLPAFGSDGTVSDPERIHFSTGKLPLAHKLTAERTPDELGKVAVTWHNDSDSILESTRDELMMVIDFEGKIWGPILTGALRKQESAVIQLPAGLETVKGIYLFFGNEERELYSVDEYFGI